ncbi:MAG: dTDP-glucose 4,6-dehydratase [Nanoarchaeota archaeon]
MKNILVTGGCGFIGSNFIRYVLSNHSNYTIVNLDKLTYAGNEENLREFKTDEKYHFKKGDICNRNLVDKIIKNGNIDTIVNFAAESHVDKSNQEEAEEIFKLTNITGTTILLERARRNKIERFLQVSTDEVYGSAQEGSFSEKSSLNPTSIYAKSKAEADERVLLYSRYINTLITRSSNNFGPYQYPEKFLSLMVTNLSLAKKIPVYGDGKQIRDWIYVEDNCEAIYFVLNNGKPGEIYNISTKNELENIEIAKKVLKLTGKNEDSIKFVLDRENHDLRYSIDNTKITELGWNTRSSFDESLEKTVNWYIKNAEWWISIRNKPEFRKWYEEEYIKKRGLE